jgi:hypothetical protein
MVLSGLTNFRLTMIHLELILSKAEDELKSNVEALDEAISLCSSHHGVENGVVTSNPFADTSKQVSYPNLLLCNVADKEYARIHNMDAVMESYSYMDEYFVDQKVNDALNFMSGAE